MGKISRKLEAFLESFIFVLTVLSPLIVMPSGLKAIVVDLILLGIVMLMGLVGVGAEAEWARTASSVIQQIAVLAIIYLDGRGLADIYKMMGAQAVALEIGFLLILAYALAEID